MGEKKCKYCENGTILTKVSYCAANIEYCTNCNYERNDQNNHVQDGEPIIIENRFKGWLMWKWGYACRHNNSCVRGYYYRTRQKKGDTYGSIFEKKEE